VTLFSSTRKNSTWTAYTIWTAYCGHADSYWKI